MSVRSKASTAGEKVALKNNFKCIHTRTVHVRLLTIASRIFPVFLFYVVCCVV